MKSDYQKTTKDGKGWLVHRLLWTEAFGEIPEGMQLHHINGNKRDNRLENLRLVTSHENMRESDRWGQGFYKSKQYKNRKRPYIAKRRMKDNKRHYLGSYGTAGGAWMAFRMAYVKS